ncbi:hypothetical protein D9M69_673180 [compost metagenome]
MRPEHMPGHGLGGVDPHGKEGKPGKKLHQGQLFHGGGHIQQAGDNIGKAVGDAVLPQQARQEEQEAGECHAAGKDKQLLIQRIVADQQPGEQSRGQEGQPVDQLFLHGHIGGCCLA